MKIALIQQHVTPNYEENLKRGIDSFHKAAKAGAGLIAYAELAFSPFLPQIPAPPDAPWNLVWTLARRLKMNL